MKKIDQTVLKETRYILIWVIFLSAVMQAAFLVSGFWDYTVLLGNLLSAAAAVLNFFLLGISVCKALEKEPDDAKKTMKLSQAYRFLFLAIILILGAVFACFHSVAVLLPMFFPRISIAFRTLFDKKQS